MTVTPLPTWTPVVVVVTPTPLPTSTPPIEERPDRCEANNRREQACPLAVDTINGPFTFVPVGDQDYYRVDLGESNGLVTTITVRSTGGELITSLTRDDGSPLGVIASPALSTTLDATMAGPIVLHVENRALDERSALQYTIEVRKSLPAPPTLPPDGSGSLALPPDRLENNWNVATAAPIAVGVVYELNFVCPEHWPGACAGGDHDYLAVPVKAGVRYLIATFDLGPGTDTVIDLFWGREDQPLTSSDDYGKGMLSVIRWVAPADGTAIVRVGPRNGGMQPIVDDKAAGSYRFAVAVAGTALEQQLRTRIDEQGLIPTPVPHPSGSTGGGPAGKPPMGTARPTSTVPVASDGLKGQVVVIEQTALREGPTMDSPTIMTLPVETRVTLTGQVVGSWVRVQPAQSVLPGWVRGAHLRPLDAETAPRVPTLAAQPTPADGNAPSPLPGVTALPSAAPPASGSRLHVVAVGLAPTPTSAPSAPESRTIQVQVCADAQTTSCRAPLAGVAVELFAAASRERLQSGRTNADGIAWLSTSVPPATRLLLHLPALGILLPLEKTDTTIPIRIPPEATT